MKIDYETFKQALTDVTNVREYQEEVSKLSANFRKLPKNKMESILYFPTLVDTVVDVLTASMDDAFNWISYWVFELNCGREYEDGMVKTAAGENIKLKTIDDLWNLVNDIDEEKVKEGEDE